MATKSYSELKEYRGNGFSISYPSDWAVKETAFSASFTSADNISSLQVAQDMNPRTQSLDEYVEITKGQITSETLAKLGNPMDSVEKSPTSKISVNGLEACQYYIKLGYEEWLIKEQQTFILVDGIVYILTATTGIKEFDNVKELFETVVSSFKPAKAEDIKFENYATARFSVEYPSAWTLQENDGYVSIVYSSGIANVNVFKEPTDARTLVEYLEIIKKSMTPQIMTDLLGVQIENIEVISETPYPKKGVEAMLLTVKMRTNGIDMQTQTLYVFREGKVYSLTATSTLAAFSRYEPIFERVFASYTLDRGEEHSQEPEMKKYETQDFSVNYPQGWTLQENENSAVMADTGGLASLTVQKKAIRGIVPEEFILGVKKSMTPQILSDLTSTQIDAVELVSETPHPVNGVDAVVLTLKMTCNNVVLQNEAMYVFKSGKAGSKAYIVTVSTTAIAFKRYEPIFDKILASFMVKE